MDGPFGGTVCGHFLDGATFCMVTGETTTEVIDMPTKLLIWGGGGGE